MGEAEGKKSKVSMLAMKSHSNTRSALNLGAKSMSRLRVRKQSFGFSGVPGIRPVERTSQVAIEFKRPPLLYLNTYQLEPHGLFHIAKVRQVTEETLDEHFTGHKYSGQNKGHIRFRKRECESSTICVRKRICRCRDVCIRNILNM